MTTLMPPMPHARWYTRQSPTHLCQVQNKLLGRSPHLSGTQTSAAVLDIPRTSPARVSQEQEDGALDRSVLMEIDVPAPTTAGPGFSSFDEAESTRSRLPVHNLELVPTIMSRNGTPVMLSVQVWLDPMMSYTPGWFESMSSLDTLGQELAASAKLDRADGSGHKYFAFVRDLWAIHEDEDQKIWHASYLNVDDKASLDDPIGRGFFTGGGPSWPASSRVTLLAKAIDTRGEFFIKSYPSAVLGVDDD